MKNLAKEKINRKDYINSKCTFEEYYSQFIDDDIIALVEKRIGKKVICNSKDEHFNDISLNLWDSVFDDVPIEITRKMKKCDDYPTMAGLVCLAKVAADVIRRRKYEG